MYIAMGENQQALEFLNRALIEYISELRVLRIRHPKGRQFVEDQIEGSISCRLAAERLYMRTSQYPRAFWIALVVAGWLATFSFSGRTASPKSGFQNVNPSSASSLQTGPYYALIIGNENYKYLAKLLTPINDANELAQLLRERYGFRTEVLLNADRRQIMTALDDYRKKLPENSNLLIYYAGHGHHDLDADEAYWLPVDAQADNNANWISSNDITSNVRAIPSSHVLIISDSCYSGYLAASRAVIAGLSPEGRNPYFAKMLESKSRNLMSSGADEPVADSGAPGHSIFAAAILESLRQMKEDYFAANDLFYHYVQPEVGGRSNQLPQYSWILNSGHKYGDFVFSRKHAAEGSTVGTVGLVTDLDIDTHSSDKGRVVPDLNSTRDNDNAEKELRPRYALKSTDTVIVADFANHTGEIAFDYTLKQGLATYLMQSPYFNLLSDQETRDTLAMMGQPADAPLTKQVAQEVCQRSQGKVVINGSISNLGSQYVVGLNAVDCQTGKSIASETAQASHREDVLEALDHSATRLRKEVGESIKSLQEYDTPLPQVTTPSLEALQAYALGRQNGSKGDFAAAIPQLQNAIQLDSKFAMAYQLLGVYYRNLKQYALACENLQKAYTLKGKVGKREDLVISSNYYSYCIGDLDQAKHAYEQWAQLYKRDYEPHTNLGGIYFILGQYEKALEQFREARSLNPNTGFGYSNLVNVYYHLGQLDEAKATYEQALAQKVDTPVLHRNRYSIAFLQQDEAEMQRQVAWSASQIAGDDILLSPESDSEAFSGHLGKARELSRRAVESANKVGEKEPAALRQMNAALREAQFGNEAQARSQTSAALELASTREVQILAALALAWIGDSDRASKMADELEKQNPGNTKIVRYWLPTIRAAVELNRKRPLVAVQILETARPFEFGTSSHEVGEMLYPVYWRGQAYLALGQGIDAAGEFKKFLTHRGAVVNCPLGALAYLGIARSYALQGESAKAREAYNDFLSLWRDADPDIPILIQAKAEYGTLK
jgi:tetratricopeptide (TPR) repeat protein